MKLEVKVMELDEKDISYIMDGALYGCSYWCNEINMKCTNTKKEDYSDLEYGVEKYARALKKGESLEFLDIEDDEKYYLTYDRLLKGVEKFIKESKNIDLSNMFEGDLDADDCDMIIQYALFGKIMFC